MGEVSSEMIWKRLDEIHTEIRGVRTELVARSDVTLQRGMAALQRDMTTLKDG